MVSSLDYENRSRYQTARNRRRLAIGVIVFVVSLCAGVLFYRAYPGVSTHIKLRMAVHDSVEHGTASKVIVFETDPIKQSALLADRENYALDSLLNAAIRKNDAWDRVVKTLTFWNNSPPMIFGTCKSDASTRIVVVYGTAVAGTGPGERYIYVQMAVVDPGSTLEKPKCVWTSDTSLKNTFVVPSGMQLRIYAAVSDTTHPFRLLADYEVGSQAGVIAVSIRNDDTVTIEVLSGPLLKSPSDEHNQ